MANSEIKVFESLCRTCMGEQQTEDSPVGQGEKNKRLVSIYREHKARNSDNIRIMELLKQTSPKLTVEPNDILPKNICECCLDILVTVHEFQIKSLEVQQKLLEIANKHYSSSEVVVDPLNNFTEHHEGVEELKIEIDESVTDVITPVKGYFTLLEKDGQIVEVYNALENCELATNDWDRRFYVDENVSSTRKQQSDTAKRKVRKSNRRLAKRKQNCIDDKASCEKKAQTTTADSNFGKEIFEEESLESEMSNCNVITLEDDSEWEPPWEKSEKLKCKNSKTTSKLERSKFDNLNCENLDRKLIAANIKTGGFPCNQCEKCFSKQVLLKAHLRKHQNIKQKQYHAENGYTCPECGIRLKTRITFRRHVMVHEKDETKIKYKCQYCSKVFNQSSALRCHVRVHTGERPYLCSICGKAFISETSLKAHYVSHGTELKYQCPKCPKRFRTSSSMWTHKTNVHTTVKPHVCDICGASFKKHYVLTKHKIIHGEKTHKCDHCEMKFCRPDQCRRHMRTHTGEKPYKCRYCERAYAQSNDMIKHLRVHLGDNVYRCEMCPQAFRLLCELRAHFASHNDDDEQTKIQNLQALKEEEERLHTKIETSKGTDQE